MSKLGIWNFIQTRILSRNLPKELYHLTPRSSYKGILEEGALKCSRDRILNKEAVFTIDIANFQREWQNVTVDGASVRENLLEQVNLYGQDVVALRIPTQNLKAGKLFVRRQDKFFDFKNGKYDEMPKNPIKIIKSLRDFVQLRYGIPAGLRKFYNKNHAYEYIYKGEIKASDIEEAIPLQEFLQLK